MSVREKECVAAVSNTLVTKILLGTLGCVPAYDRFFIGGVKYTSISTGIYGIWSILKLADYYEDNTKQLEEVRGEMLINKILPYP